MPDQDDLRPFPAPDTSHPVRLPDGSPHAGTVFLSAAVDHARFVVGDYTYASAFDPPEDWAARLAPYLFDFSPEQLHIGKFCQIADGVVFITSSANHRYDGISSYPFAIFGGGPIEDRPSMPGPGADTCIGNDVWIGQGARILPGANIGDGVIVGAGAVVAGRVPAYSIIGGNPARVLRQRFSQADAGRLQRIAWWDWPIDLILAHESLIMAGNVDALELVAPD
ncbi:CatB-related O-acetyltransferase [Sulfitobacter mediterraneus]|uniref:CatB-related O-acetyltransferase n=1 Tax=Sulfitobacter mediterraneus TaxID=83219 RepID=UPI0019327124|nr:CatB-related O-acetyltransferase [Sulfitobacter mediterraneus]MBM1633467.1 CatB-related O-acetyltransferase [Sulfitobacter mediterraneus]MBM1642017.1 CatB-related O-acetyltransferase [Sulfitobacter mediterraneus]MBM1645332.1 CatB-related O-acetyltransferase [Sulfitobacter mediterraneus]MBM1648519.1 CatB-related O-acetyltransferase [Sulfitobacter mediterraneus]MBM1655171.1 CatB-related O-acetyltransferase [Sulfitobacter mediterraneus]